MLKNMKKTKKYILIIVLISFVLLIGTVLCFFFLPALEGKKIKGYGLSRIELPEWVHIESSWYAGEEKKDNMEYNNNNILFHTWGTWGYNYDELGFLINPKIDYKYLYLEELSINKGNEIIYLVKNKKIKYPLNIFNSIVKLRYNNYQKYFKNIKLNDSIDVIVKVIYKFDDEQLIIEKTPYKIICYESKYNYFHRFIWWYI